MLEQQQQQQQALQQDPPPPPATYHLCHPLGSMPPTGARVQHTRAWWLHECRAAAGQNWRQGAQSSGGLSSSLATIRAAQAILTLILELSQPTLIPSQAEAELQGLYALLAEKQRAAALHIAGLELQQQRQRALAEQLRQQGGEERVPRSQPPYRRPALRAWES